MSAPVRRAGHPFALQPREPDRPAGTLSHGRSLDRLKRHAETDHPESGTGLSPPVFCAPALVAGHDAPLIDERATPRCRIATEGGDAHAGVKRALPVRVPASRTGSNAGTSTRLATD
jgi:hypothetical protein